MDVIRRADDARVSRLRRARETGESCPAAWAASSRLIQVARASGCVEFKSAVRTERIEGVLPSERVQVVLGVEIL